MKCFNCKNGEYNKVVQDFETPVGKRGKIIGKLTVPNIEVLTCPLCGDECLDAANSRKIDQAREEKFPSN